MGLMNSSLTRVQPIFQELLRLDPTGTSWIAELWKVAVGNRGRVVAAPIAFGPLLARETFERPVPPSKAFLRWAIENPHRLTQLPAPRYGASSPAAQAKRAALFGRDLDLRRRTQAEALEALEQVGSAGSAHQWWAFEGFTHVDAAFEMAECLLFVEGKRTETVSASTRWFAQRNQLWRNVEVAGEVARDRQFGVLLAVESDDAGKAALEDAKQSRDSSYPHLSIEERQRLDRHWLGYVVWSEIVATFGLPPSVLKKTSA